VVRVCEGERRGDEGRRLPGTMRIEASMGNWRNEWTRAFQNIVFFLIYQRDPSGKRGNKKKI
jgi:hypothetical protein